MYHFKLLVEINIIMTHALVLPANWHPARTEKETFGEQSEPKGAKVKNSKSGAIRATRSPGAFGRLR